MAKRNKSQDDSPISFPDGITFNQAKLSTTGSIGAPGINIGAWTNLTSLSLPKGRWVLTGGSRFGGSSGPNAGIKNLAISINSGATTTDHVLGQNQIFWILNSASDTDPWIQVTHFLELSSTTTVYLKIQDSIGTDHRGNHGMQAMRVG